MEKERQGTASQESQDIRILQGNFNLETQKIQNPSRPRLICLNRNIDYIIQYQTVSYTYFLGKNYIYGSQYSEVINISLFMLFILEFKNLH